LKYNSIFIESTSLRQQWRQQFYYLIFVVSVAKIEQGWASRDSFVFRAGIPKTLVELLTRIASVRATYHTWSWLFEGATTFSMTTFNIMTLRIKDWYVTLSITMFCIVLSVIMLNVALYLLLCWMSLYWVSWRLNKASFRT
jgi:hypothetical protein